MVSFRVNWEDLDLDLDLNSARVYMDTLGYLPTPFLSAEAHSLCHFQIEYQCFRSLLTVSLPFVLGRPGPLLNHGISQYGACRGMRSGRQNQKTNPTSAFARSKHPMTFDYIWFGGHKAPCYKDIQLQDTVQ